MKDLIERQVIINKLKPWLRISGYSEGELNMLNAILYELENIPSAQPEQRWIPCSERLPDKFGQVLVTFVPGAGTLWTKVIIARYSDLMGIAKPCFWVGNVGKNDFENISKQVIAWMPLPEAYKGGEDETDRR